MKVTLQLRSVFQLYNYEKHIAHIVTRLIRFPALWEVRGVTLEKEFLRQYSHACLRATVVRTAE